MRNERTPRTLAESHFVTGYRSAGLRPPTRLERIADVLLATGIGIFVALALVHWWST
jgi:hypothetical protein